MATQLLTIVLALLAFQNPEPKVLLRVEPEYPQAARAAGVQGTVRLRVTIRQDGSVEDAAVLQGNTLLNEAAIAAVRQWRFEPGRARTNIMLSFSLPPSGFITGRVLDAEGEPVAGVQISTRRLYYKDGKRAWALGLLLEKTDAQGTFRLRVDTGDEHYLVVTNQVPIELPPGPYDYYPPRSPLVPWKTCRFSSPRVEARSKESSRSRSSKAPAHM